MEIRYFAVHIAYHCMGKYVSSSLHTDVIADNHVHAYHITKANDDRKSKNSLFLMKPMAVIVAEQFQSDSKVDEHTLATADVDTIPEYKSVPPEPIYGIHSDIYTMVKSCGQISITTLAKKLDKPYLDVLNAVCKLESERHLVVEGDNEVCKIRKP